MRRYKGVKVWLIHAFSHSPSHTFAPLREVRVIGPFGDAQKHIFYRVAINVPQRQCRWNDAYTEKQQTGRISSKNKTKREEEDKQRLST